MSEEIRELLLAMRSRPESEEIVAESVREFMERKNTLADLVEAAQRTIFEDY